MIKYLCMCGLENCENDVFYGAFPLNEFLHNNSITTMYSSTIFILNSLSIKVSLNESNTEIELIYIIKSCLMEHLEKNFLKLFKVKSTFHWKTYLSINKFNLQNYVSV